VLLRSSSSRTPSCLVIAREGYTVIAAIAVLALLVGFGAVQFDAWIWRVPLLMVAIGGVAFTLYFCRDPERTPPPHARKNGLVAPADGRVVEIAEKEAPIYIDGRARRVSIFLSPLDVHVNRVPVLLWLEKPIRRQTACAGLSFLLREQPPDCVEARLAYVHPEVPRENRTETRARHPTVTSSASAPRGRHRITAYLVDLAPPVAPRSP